MSSEERTEVVWQNGVIESGDRKGSFVLIGELNQSGHHQVIFATGASAFYLPKDIKILGDR